MNWNSRLGSPRIVVSCACLSQSTRKELIRISDLPPQRVPGRNDGWTVQTGAAPRRRLELLSRIGDFTRASSLISSNKKQLPRLSFRDRFWWPSVSTASSSGSSCGDIGDFDTSEYEFYVHVYSTCVHVYIYIYNITCCMYTLKRPSITAALNPQWIPAPRYNSICVSKTMIKIRNNKTVQCNPTAAI